jgi:hypothetical protein
MRPDMQLRSFEEMLEASQTRHLLDIGLCILMSACGGGRSIYLNFFGRGRNISFPKDSTMEIGFGGQTATPISSVL